MRTINEYDRVKASYNTKINEKVGTFNVTILNIFSDFTFRETPLFEDNKMLSDFLKIEGKR